MNKELLMVVNRQENTCGDGCCTDIWHDIEIWSLDENGMTDERVFNFTEVRDLDVFDSPKDWFNTVIRLWKLEDDFKDVTIIVRED